MDIVFTIHDPMWGNPVTLFCFYGVQALQTEIRLDGWLHFLFVYVKLADRVIRPEEVAPDTYEGKFIMKKNILVVSMVLSLFASCTQSNNRNVNDPWVNERDQRQDSIERAEDSIRQEERINLLKNSVKITKAWLSNPNSAGGVDANVYYKNLSDKTIKYFDWTGYPINAVGDRVGCEIRGYGEYRGRDTGPVKPKHTNGGCWDCAWYNNTARKLVLTGIEITYMDGSSLTIQDDEISYVWK